jgi:hypothetical protein
MGKQRERFESWFRRWRGVRTRQEEAALLKVADAFDAAVASDELTAKQLKIVVQAASSARALLWMNATELLGAMAVRWTIAADAVVQMSANRQSHVRFASLCCLRDKTPRAVIRQLLQEGLADKSSRVRWKAAQKVHDFERKDLLPQLNAALTRETNAKARAEMELHLRLLRDGYIAERSDRSGFYVTVGFKGSISSRFVSRELMKEKGVDAIATEVRRDLMTTVGHWKISSSRSR